MLKHRPIQNHYDFELEAGIVKHCLGAKIVDIAMFMLNCGVNFTTKVSCQFACAHVLHAPHHLVTLAIDISSRNVIIVPIFTSLGQIFPKSEDSQRARALHVHYAPQQPKSCTIEWHSLNCISAPNFTLLAQRFPKVKVPMYVQCSRA